jgi:predicted MFS family arabinose efflux permease
VTDNSTGFDLHTIGIILLVVGAVGLVASLVSGTFIGFRSTKESHVSSDGRTVVEQERVSGV